MIKIKANMCFSKTSFAFFYLVFSLYFSSTNTVIFVVVNQCNYTVWAASIPRGGGQRLNPGQSWTINVEPNTTQGRIWGRTNCSFDSKGHGKCQTGDCNGLLQCQSYGNPPNTLAEFSLNQLNNLDFFDISLFYGFNVPMDFSPTTNVCRGIQCSGPINEECPDEVRAPGGCLNPCAVDDVNSTFNKTEICRLTLYSRFFKERCPDAYSHAADVNSTFTCPGGTNYRVVFCPSQDDDHTNVFSNTCPDGTDYWVLICPS